MIFTHPFVEQEVSVGLQREIRLRRYRTSETLLTIVRVAARVDQTTKKAEKNHQTSNTPQLYV